MPKCNNKKLKDKEFLKKYGKETVFHYGCENGEHDVYVYRMTLTTPNGNVVEYPWSLVKTRCEQMNVKHCPELDKFLYTTQEDLLERVAKHEGGPDPIGKTHIREGIVVRIDDRQDFTAFKQKNVDFKILEGIIKSEDIVDMEEQEDMNE